MASAKPEQDAIAQRREITDNGEPLLTVSRQARGRDGELTANIPSVAVDIIEVEQGQRLAIDVFENGVFIRRERTDEQR